MNRKIIKSYIEEYKQEFDRVHKLEIYKWKGVKHFRDNFDIGSIKVLEKTGFSVSIADNPAEGVIFYEYKFNVEEKYKV